MLELKKLVEKWCSMWDDELLLLTPECLDEVKDWEVLYVIYNKKIIVGKDEKFEELDRDTRCGVTAYWIRISKEEKEKLDEYEVKEKLNGYFNI